MSEDRKEMKFKKFPSTKERTKLHDTVHTELRDLACVTGNQSPFVIKIWLRCGGIRMNLVVRSVTE